ncbi:hypothetical protein B0H13DRAFT_1862980 [Mycena leptocephala]|nr:hypothetical protein B0H13DRAFT_1862980 [Mycena leptocephala]
MVQHSLLVQRADNLISPNPQYFYVTVTVGYREFRSDSVRSTTASPTWNFESKFKIMIRIIGEKDEGKGARLGECKLTTSRLMQKCASGNGGPDFLNPQGGVFVRLRTNHEVSASPSPPVGRANSSTTNSWDTGNRRVPMPSRIPRYRGLGTSKKTGGTTINIGTIQGGVGGDGGKGGQSGGSGGLGEGPRFNFTRSTVYLQSPLADYVHSATSSARAVTNEQKSTVGPSVPPAVRCWSDDLQLPTWSRYTDIKLDRMVSRGVSTTHDGVCVVVNEATLNSHQAVIVKRFEGSDREKVFRAFISELEAHVKLWSPDTECYPYIIYHSPNIRSSMPLQQIWDQVLHDRNLELAEDLVKQLLILLRDHISNSSYEPSTRSRDNLLTGLVVTQNNLQRKLLFTGEIDITGSQLNATLKMMVHGVSGSMNKGGTRCYWGWSSTELFQSVARSEGDLERKLTANSGMPLVKWLQDSHISSHKGKSRLRELPKPLSRLLGLLDKVRTFDHLRK